MSVSDTMDHVLKNLMISFGPLVFKEAHRFRGAILDEPIDHHAKKIRFLLTLAICEMKVFTRLLVVSTYDLIEEMNKEYEINRDMATITIRAIARLHNIDEKVEDKSVEDKSKDKVEDVQHKDELPKKLSAEEKERSKKENERVANLYSSNVAEEKKITKKPEEKPQDITEAKEKKLKILSRSEPEKEKTKAVKQEKSKEILKPDPKPHLVGDLVFFGQYKWRILKINSNNTALIITEDIINKMAYHNRKIGISWERSDMRKYLNSTFLSKFNNLEQNMIMSTEINNKFNEKYFTQGGQKTVDKVFLLSIEEVRNYFPRETDRIAKFERSATWWWLRSPGIHDDHAAFVYGSGSISLDGEVSVYTYEGNKGMHFVGYRVGGVRPAMVIGLNGVTKA